MKDVLKLYNDYPPGALKLLFTTNHDENTWNGTEYEKYGDTGKTLCHLHFYVARRSVNLQRAGITKLKRLKFFDKDEIEWTSEEPALQNFYQRLTNLK